VSDTGNRYYRIVDPYSGWVCMMTMESGPCEGPTTGPEGAGSRMDEMNVWKKRSEDDE
jgi:hypothetical protein